VSRAAPGRGLIAGAAAGLTAAGAARLAYAAVGRRPPGGTGTWSRINHRGEPVTLLEGPAMAAGAIAGVLAQGSMQPAAWRPALAMAAGAAGAAAFGAYDDLAGSGDRRGFRGHLGALRHAEITTGAVKLGGIGVTGIISAALAGGPLADVMINAGLVAGGANLLNLFDLRPGRAIKVAVVSGALLAAGAAASTARSGVMAPAPAAARAPLPPLTPVLAPLPPLTPAFAPLPPLAAALALMPEDLGERAMLGDCGANALGAMLGAAAAGLPRAARIALLAGITGLTAASEKVSFTKVIESTPALHWLDMLGRRPADSAPRVLIPARQDPMAAAGAGTTGRSEKTDPPPPGE
jgi:UDP-GlcNAc:undecaprenyl-phosphate/decaprenyl-phosphate GlcNAc-1-phosphate transferase